MRLTPALDPQTALAGGSVELVYAVGGRTGGLEAHDAEWAPASRRRDVG